MRIKFWSGKAGVWAELVVEDFVHILSRYPIQLSLPAILEGSPPVPVPKNYLFDFGSCSEVIVLRGKTDESDGPTENELKTAIREWGFGASPISGIGMPVLYEDEHSSYLGQFGRSSFDRKAAVRGAVPFMIEFRIHSKIFTP